MGGAVRLSKGRFLATFLVLFAALLGGWSATNGAYWYSRGLVSAAATMGPPIHGWVLVADPTGGQPSWVSGSYSVRTAIQFDALAVGVVPALALLGATPGLGWLRRVIYLVAGGGLCFLIDTLIVALFPLLVFYKNPFTDVVGTFLGLVGFVGAPVIVWGALTFRQLQRMLPALRRHP